MAEDWAVKVAKSSCIPAEMRCWVNLDAGPVALDRCNVERHPKPLGFEYGSKGLKS